MLSKSSLCRGISNKNFLIGTVFHPDMVKIKIHVFPKETNYLYLKYWQQPICDDVQVIKLSQVKTSELCIFYILECHDSKSIQATRGQLYAELVATIKELNYLKDLDTASAIHLQIYSKPYYHAARTATFLSPFSILCKVHRPTKSTARKTFFRSFPLMR